MKVRKGGGKEIPLVQGKEQRLCFAGAAVKRYATPNGREGNDLGSGYRSPTLVKGPWASSEINLTLENKSVSQESD